MEKYDKVYDNFPCIEDEFLNLLYIPLMDKYNKVSGYAISNLELKDKLLKFRYHQFIKMNKTIKRYAVSNLGISMHEIVIGAKAPSGYVIDHLDSDGLLNTEENLRYAIYGLNSQNKQKQSNTTSKYIGVTLNKNRNKWVTRISYNNEPINLGSYEDEIEAAKVYDIYAIYYYKGQSPKTNDLLTKSEIQDIKNNGIPEKYQRKTRDLPKNISVTANKTYSVGITSNNKRYGKTVKTLEEAILLKTQIYEELEKMAENKRDKEITRNDEGLAVIYTTNDLTCLVDEDHWHDLIKYKWGCCKSVGENSYPYSNINGKKITLHAYIYKKYVCQVPNNMTVDHVISSNIMDVRLQNLRLADHSLQNHNKNVSKNRIDKYRGISFKGSNYEVTINECYYGMYKTAEEAAEKANEIYTKIYGDDANLNIIDHSKKTNKFNRIPSENITKEYIINLTKVVDVKNIVTAKNLNYKAGGEIKLDKIKLDNLNEYKQIILDTLYPSSS